MQKTPHPDEDQRRAKKPLERQMLLEEKVSACCLNVDIEFALRQVSVIMTVNENTARTRVRQTYGEHEVDGSAGDSRGE